VRSTEPTNATISRDGKRIAYVSSIGATTIHIQSYPVSGPDITFAATGSDTPKHPRWSPGGDQLYYDPRPDSFKVVGVRTQPTFGFLTSSDVVKNIQLAPPARARLRRHAGRQAPGHDHRRREGVGALRPHRIKLTTNWFEELKQRVPRK
jgi:hypothetical protein